MLLPAVLGLVVIAGMTPIGRAPRLMLVDGAVGADGAGCAGGVVGVVGADGAVALPGLTLARQHQRHITRPTASGPEQTRLPYRAVSRGLRFRRRAVGHRHGRGR